VKRVSSRLGQMMLDVQAGALLQVCSARLARAQAPWQRLWWEGLGESGA